MPVVKGGVWKNTEDEILKAAVSKYGMNQWARISSLLVRKTPKQCKARWFEWLSPSIIKTEWSKEEDEKLLHLAKLMPTQWRTIAQVVGRTATQCLERYQKLLDEAEARESGEFGLGGVGAEAQAPMADDGQRLRPGEIDPDPETRRALPDPVDMDEDEKEMLSEARARLANTQGKKAKRKARERQLEEAKRLATLQKRRELKAAGINTKLHFRRRGQMDYNADIPFERKPAQGFYDTTEELARNAQEVSQIDLRKVQVNKKRPGDEEEEERRKKQRRNKGQDNNNDAQQAAQRARQMQKLKEAEQLAKRRPLNLPQPQVGESELEDIVKIGLAGDSVRDLVDEGEAEGGTRRLLSDYTRMTSAMPIRTPRTPAAEDHLATEARNLRALTQTQSSLLGGENTPLHEGGTGFTGVTPIHRATATPNPLATPIRNGHVGATPLRPGATPLRTPRDNLSINQPGESQANLARKEILRGFASLPKPKNDYELVLPDEVDENMVSIETNETLSVEDATERDRRLKALADAAQVAEFKRRSQVVQRNLPRPLKVNAQYYLEALDKLDTHYGGIEDTETDSSRSIMREMIKLLVWDAKKFPIEGGQVEGDVDNYEDFEQETIESGRKLIEEDAKGLDWDIWEEAWREMDEQPTKGASDIKALQEKITNDATTGNKVEKKLSMVLGGYQARSQTLTIKLHEAFVALEQARNDLDIFKTLQIGEEASIPERIQDLEREIGVLERREANVQSRYGKLLEEKRELERRLAAGVGAIVNGNAVNGP